MHGTQIGKSPARAWRSTTRPYLRVGPCVNAFAVSETCLSKPSTGCDRHEVSVTKSRRKQEPVLQAKLKAHSASLTAALVIVDEPGLKEFATASLDKTLATWMFEPDLENPLVAVQRSEVVGAPVFSLTSASSGKGGSSGSNNGNGSGGNGNGSGGGLVWCGLATKEIAGWQPGSSTLDDKVRMNGHTGWVRSLATSGRYLFSCGCNHLRQWDTTYSVPKEVASHSLFTGDILAIAATDKRVFTAGADGSVRAWAISGRREGKEGELREVASREKAHDGRVTALAVAGSLVFTVSYDGRIKGWDVDSLNLVVKRTAAHGGQRIQCAAVGGDGLLYTGGDDGLVRRWDPVELEPLGEPLDAHGGSSVRVLAGGKLGGSCLISGDAGGEVAVWAI